MSDKLNSKVEFTVSNKTIFRILSTIILFLLFLGVLRLISHALSLIFLSAFLALALNPVVTWLTRRIKTKSRVGAIAITYIAVLALLATFFSLVIPPLVRQTTEFISTVPDTISNFSNQDTSISRFVYKYELDGQLAEIGQEFSMKAKDLKSGAFSTVGKIGSAILSIVTVLVLTFMMLVEGPGWLEKFWASQQKEKRQHRKEVALRMYHVITGYVNGQLIITTIAASFALIALLIASTVFDASINPVGLAGIVAILGLIPLIGNTLAAIIVVLACLLVSTPLALVMAIFFVVYQQVENVTIQPYIQSRKNELTPLLVFIAAILGATVGGLLGAFVAIPTAGCLKILVEDIYDKRIRSKS